MEREIVIVGAGPSGSAAATALAQAGHDVLLLDRQAFPRDKVCGDSIPTGAVELLYSLGMEERIRDAGFYPVDRFLLCSPRGHVLEADINGGRQSGASSYVVPRIHFDALIQQYAIESGAKFHQSQVLEPILEDGGVVGVRTRSAGTTEDIRAKIVIGADGVSSVVARSLRPDRHEDRHRAVAIRAYIDGIDERPNQIEFYLSRRILPGYAWIFPIGEGRANIGLGIRLDKYRACDNSLEDMLDIFLDMPTIKERLRTGHRLRNMTTGQLNLGSQDIQRSYNGALLVGDAAGLINPLTGGGIRNALVSAVLAADVVHNALTENDLSLSRLRRFDLLCRGSLRSDMRRAYFVQRNLLSFPVLVDLLVQLSRSSGGSAVANCLIASFSKCPETRAPIAPGRTQEKP